MTDFFIGKSKKRTLKKKTAGIAEHEAVAFSWATAFRMHAAKH